MVQSDVRDEIEIFLQAQGIPDILLIRVPRNGTVRDILEVARARGIDSATGGEPVVLAEDSEDPLRLDAELGASGITHRGRVHVGRCRLVDVTVNFNGEQTAKRFPPSATVGRVKKWASGKQGFDLTDLDAAEHLLQVCGSTARPDEDAHVGTLVASPECRLCLDLVPKQRVEG